MIEAFGNIWENTDKYDAIVITTNGFVKNNGKAVMGRGIALQAAELFPEMPGWLGYMIGVGGNNVHMTSFDYGCVTDNGNDVCEQVVFTFPVKTHWRLAAELSLIRRSAIQLACMVDEFGYMKKVLMPRPGCGNGKLSWEDVKPIIEPCLDDRFTVMERYEI